METPHEASLKKLFDYFFRVASVGRAAAQTRTRTVAGLVGFEESTWRRMGGGVGDERTHSGPSFCFRELGTVQVLMAIGRLVFSRYGPTEYSLLLP